MSITARERVGGWAACGATTGTQWATKRWAAGFGNPAEIDRPTETLTVDPATAVAARRGLVR